MKTSVFLTALAVLFAFFNNGPAAAGAFDVKTFSPWQGYAVPNGEWRLLDFNGDGRKDVVHIVNATDYVHTWASNGNGTFTVGTFRPWAGYAMPNGLWLVADLNGDGREDLVHAVQNSDYVHTWISNGNGTFRVGTFRPWAGYAIPNGEWRALDFDGDGRTDIVHVTTGGYAHTWRSNGDGTFAVGTFRPWAGYATPNGLWLTGDFDNDGKGDLVHAVQNSTYVHTWLSNGNGTFRVGTFQPWPGYAVPNGLWLAGDLSGDRKTDILHAVQNSNYTHPWLSTLPRPGEFGLDGLEITQAIQDMPHSVGLVASKPTTVRVYPMFNGSSTRQVRGRLWVRNTAGAPWQLLSSQNSATVNPAENGNLRLKRENTDRGLIFNVPMPVLAGGTFVAWMQDLSDAATGGPVTCADCRTTHRAMALGDANPMRVRVLGLTYRAGSPAQTFTPQPIDYALTRSWLTRVYPTGDLRMTTGAVAATATPPFTCNNANAQLTAIRNADIAGGTDRRTHYYGLVYDIGAPGFFMRGCAAGIPSSPSPGTVASGPTGPGTWGWDTDGSYGDWYTGHELGHTYGRLHLGSGCGDSSDDPNYPFTNGRISGEDGAFVGFDTGDAANGIPARALPGRDWSDVMSYCANQWISAYTYNLIRTRLAAENALPAGPEPQFAGADAAPQAAMAGPPAIVDGPDLGIGVTTAMVAPAYAAPAEIVAASTAPESVPAPALAAPAPITTGEQVTLDAEFAETETPPNAGETEGRPLPGAVSDGEAGAVEVAAGAASGERQFIEGDFLAVVASVNLTQGTATIVDARRVGQGLVPVGDPGGVLVLRGTDAAGNEIGRWNVPFLPNSEREPGEDLAGVMDAVVPFPEGLRSVELLIGDMAVARFSAPEPGALPPLDSFRADAGALRAERTEDNRVLVGFSGIGAAPEGVSYEVQASADGGATWSTLAIGLAEPQAEIDLGGLGAGPVQLRVIVKDGFETQVIDTAEIPAER